MNRPTKQSSAYIYHSPIDWKYTLRGVSVNNRRAKPFYYDFPSDQRYWALSINDKRVTAYKLPPVKGMVPVYRTLTRSWWWAEKRPASEPSNNRSSSVSSALLSTITYCVPVPWWALVSIAIIYALTYLGYIHN